MKTLLTLVLLVCFVGACAPAKASTDEPCIERVGDSCNYKVVCADIDTVYYNPVERELGWEFVEGWLPIAVDENGLFSMDEHPEFCDTITPNDEITWGSVKSIYR